MIVERVTWPPLSAIMEFACRHCGQEGGEGLTGVAIAKLTGTCSIDPRIGCWICTGTVTTYKVQLPGSVLSGLW
jgi:3'-phosphoadenosine 5'-phosphosulfate sulfotransferase (PAPS reductase)/FAD synthetase